MTDEQRAKRIHYHMYETCEGIAEHAERIVALEEENAKLRELASLMAVSWLPNDVRMTPDEWHDRDERICDELRKLGIEVGDD